VKEVQLITDGSCIGNPNAGGWAWILNRIDATPLPLTGARQQAAGAEAL